MSDTVIKVNNLSKRYQIGAQQKTYKTFQETLLNVLKAPVKNFRRLQNLAKRVEDSNDIIWALKDISFEIKRGEVIGIIGKNGSGKSTLLKILSRITEPTEGCVELRGRVSSLLEVGTGFHRELTGRENIYLNGSILGMRKWEIDKKFDEIVAFSEIEKFIDTPVKHYSSGMYVRLAFAVAAHLEPDMLLVDEVLAVGDIAFQKKCLGKMGDIAKEGRTVLFVSHNMGAIARLCNRSLWLNQGKIELDGLSNEVMNRYQSKYLTHCIEWKRPSSKNIGDDFSFLSVTVRNNKPHYNGIFNGDEPISVEISYIVHRSLSGCQIGSRIYNSESIVVFSTADSDSYGVSALPKEPGCYKATFTIPAGFLPPSTYSISIAAHLPGRNLYDVVEQAAVFEISTSGSLVSLDGRLGIVTPLIHWEAFRESLS